MGYDRKYLIWSLFYAIGGMSLGIYMAASHNHAQHVTHAHILLVGFVVSLLYGVIHKLWLPAPSARVARLQLYLHQVGALAMFSGLLLLYGEVLAETQVEPVLAIASIIVLTGAVTMLYLILTSRVTQG